MARSVNNWSERFEETPVKATVQVVFLVVILGVAVMMALWGFGVVTAPWKGAGDAYQQQQSAQNWVAAQRQFHQEFNDVRADSAKIADAQRKVIQYEAQPRPADPIALYGWQQQDNNLNATLTGLEQQCVNTVDAYNTDAKSYLTQNWRDADLPQSLPLSDCDAPRQGG